MGRKRGPSPWNEATILHAALALGEELLSLTRHAVAAGWPAGRMFREQRRLIERVAARLLNGRAHLWLNAPHEEPWLASILDWKPPQEQPGGLIHFVRETRKAAYEPCEQGTAWRTLDDFPAEALGRALAAPLLIRDRRRGEELWWGVLQVARDEPPYWPRAALEQLQALALQAALGLEATLQTAREQWRVQQLHLVRQVSLQIAGLRDLDELACRLTHLIRQTFGYYAVALFTLEAGAEQLVFRALSAPAIESEKDQRDQAAYFQVRVGEGLVGYVAASGQEVIAPEVSADPRYRYIDILPDTRSEAALPLKVRDRLLGVLDVQSDRANGFSELDMVVLRTLADNIALALQEARLYGALTRRAAQLETLYEVSSAITSILDQETLLNEVVSLIQQRFGYPYVHLFSVHPGRRKVIYEAGSGPRSQALQAGEFAYDLDDPQGIIPWVAREGRPLLAGDVSQEPRYRPSPLPPDETRSELCVPLLFGGEVLGVLDVQSDRLHAFSEDDLHLFEALADHIAIALRNASLYRSEAWRRQVADSLREVAGLLSADVALDQVLHAILALLGRTLPLDVAAIWLSEPAEEEGASTPALHLAAVIGDTPNDLALDLGLSPEEVLECNLERAAPLPVEQASQWLTEALHAESPVVRATGALYEPLGAVLGFPADYSAIAAPLRVGAKSLGVLVLAHRTAGRYGSEAKAMTAAFASSAAVAIENTRLYQEAQDQAWVSTLLLQVSQATQAITDLNELLNTIARITPLLTGVRTGWLLLLDEEGNFVPVAGSGGEAPLAVSLEGLRFVPGEAPALERLLVEQEPLFLHSDAPEDWPLVSLLVGGRSPRAPADLGLVVLVPMIARGEVLGAFLVEYDLSPALSSGKPLEAFFAERLAILQGIAHQTAVAVDNLRLIRSQKEEAYTSVALLQVAQAVVSSNSLEEALGAIVRLTPILVGVKRALIFLWEEAAQAFRLAQAYGLPAAPGSLVYAPAEFPLLEAVLEHKALLASPLWGELSETDEVPKAWTSLPAPALERVEHYLANAPCLLLAFPLAVKGNILGVFLVEEPSALSPGEWGGSANRRLRSRRLEIITGICQQVALAIENELLQRERLERERLEREMQLARQIQRTFLPQSLPELPGWELHVLWLTARQVGGDFYDVFELPEGRLGLVIADVADKGMPAALYMTLVRTLLRATVKEIASPGLALERANDVLVPDAQEGMFVTIFYAMLDPASGELRYANAGHNPPLWVRWRQRKLERLTRSGMAIGVQLGTSIGEERLTLEPGDFLVLYTDGVTEAFSSQEEPFGEERLQAVIEELVLRSSETEARALTAAELLDGIDQAVRRFTEQVPLSDDLTLLVLHRRKETI